MQQLGWSQPHQTSRSNTYTIHDIPIEVLRLCFAFLGTGYFRFIGGTCRTFREVYLSMNSIVDPTTTAKNIVSSVSCVELYLQEGGTDFKRLGIILDGAAAYGRVEILEWAHHRGYSHACRERTSTNAVKHGQLAALIWLRDHGCSWGTKTCSHAALQGHLNILQWLRANRCPWKEDTCSAAAFNGHIEILQ